MLFDWLLAVLRLAVTPVGTPETAKFTIPLKPFWPVTVNALLWLVPPPISVRLLCEAASVKPCARIVTVTIVELLAVPEVPVMVMG